MSRKSKTELPQLIELVERLRAAGEGAAAVDQINDEGGTLVYRGGAYVMALGGARGSSTVGPLFAMDSWLRSARLKLQPAAS